MLNEKFILTTCYCTMIDGDLVGNDKFIYHLLCMINALVESIPAYGEFCLLISGLCFTVEQIQRPGGKVA